MAHRLHEGSVLPRVDVQRTAWGTFVRAVGPTADDVMGLVLYGIALLIFIAAALVPRGSVTSHAVRVANAGGVFMLFLGMLTQFLKRRRLFRGTLLVHPWPIRLGDNVKVNFRAMLKKSAPVSSLTAKLQCTEHVRIGYGREQAKKSAVIHEVDLPCSKQERRIVEEEWTFAIPPALPPSLDVHDSRIEWRVAAALTTAGVEIPADFVLLVIPEVAE